MLLKRHAKRFLAVIRGDVVEHIHYCKSRHWRIDPIQTRRRPLRLAVFLVKLGNILLFSQTVMYVHVLNELDIDSGGMDPTFSLSLRRTTNINTF